MKLLRYGNKGQEIPCALDEAGHIRDLSSVTDDFQGTSVSLKNLKALRQIDLHGLPILPHGARIGACLADTPNFYCVGLNYAKHATESGLETPSEPIIFNKATSAISGPHDPIIIPEGSRHTDWEVELGLVIGAPCFKVTANDALHYVSGYFTANDVSERTFQSRRAGQWIKGKSAPSFGPIGPYLVTEDEISNPDNLAVSTVVNGKIMQNSNTSDMIFSVSQIIENISQYCTLRTGDIILTGTPEGVGAGMKPKPLFLRTGDTVEVEVAGLGAQKMDVI